MSSPLTRDDIIAAALTVPLFPIDSAVIKAVGYENGLLVVQFHTGSRRAYETTSDLYSQFVFADSAGKFFAQYIKGKLSSTLLTGQCANCHAKNELLGSLCTQCGTGTVREVDPVHQERYEGEANVKKELAAMRDVMVPKRKRARKTP